MFVSLSAVFVVVTTMTIAIEVIGVTKILIFVTIVIVGLKFYMVCNQGSKRARLQTGSKLSGVRLGFGMSQGSSAV